MPKRRVAKNEYTVGWVCALPHELAAAKCMLEEIHEDLEEQDASDHNTYQLGRIHYHDIVIACLPTGVYGTTTAASVAKDMLRTFPSIRFGLMVGIGGAAPSSNHDIRLGDVVVSEPTGASGGVIQYDRGKANYDHPKTNATCERCDPQAQVERTPRQDTDPQIHYGNIASSNQVMKDGMTRDRLCEELDVLCFEMEAAGLMPDFPCLVIRGICDYSDSHKNDKWQKYAAAVAAGFARELLGGISTDRVRQEKAIVRVSDPILHQITSSINVQMQVDAERQESRYENDRHRACHQALKTSTYEQFKNNNPDRVPNTCRWVLENNKYAQWWQGQKDDLLWISADPGCGKSVLARSLIDNEFRSTNTHTICYFFFKDNEEQNSLTTALCAILHQLFDAQPQLLRYAMASWNKNGQKLQSEVYELWRILQTAVTSTDGYRVTVVIDALDETCQKDRQILIELLHTFYSQSSRLALRRSCLKFLVTSRPYNEIEDDFKRIRPHLPMIRLHGELENDKIHEEINLVVRLKVAALAVENDLSRNTTEKLKQKLLKMKHRTYLWLYLAIGEVENIFKRSFQPNSELIESILLPTSVEDAYEKILTRVPKSQKEMVIQIFYIIVGARRPLTTGEMAMALGIHLRRGLQSFAEFKIAESRLKRIICDLCGLFVFINHSKVYLIHETAKEFLVQRGLEPMAQVWKHSLNLSKSEKIMARVCVEYLSLSEIYDVAESAKRLRFDYRLENDGLNDDLKDALEDALRQSEMKEKHEIGVLLFYSSEHWAAHFRNADFEPEDAVVSKARELCRVQGNQFPLWFPVIWQASDEVYKLSGMSDLRVAAFNGHEIILKMILDSDSIDLQTEGNHRQWTALMWASSEGHDKIVRMLLERGANANARNFFGQNALESAMGHENTAKMLLEKHADMSSSNEVPNSALFAVSKGGCQNILQMLLDRDVDVNAPGWDRWNALSAASLYGHENIVQILLDRGADVNAQLRIFGSALQIASKNGNENIVRMLLDKNANVNAQNDESNKGITSVKYYGNALQAASAEGHENIVKILLEKGANVNARTDSETALQAASARGHEDIVKMLLDRGADVNVRDEIHGNALFAASAHGCENIVRILLDKGAHVNARNKNYDNALPAASANSHEKIVQLLLDRGADVNAQNRDHLEPDAFFYSALYAASRIGHEQIVQILLDRGADVNLRTGMGDAIQVAVVKGHVNIVKILLDRVADVNDPTWVDKASASTEVQENIVKTLRSIGAIWEMSSFLDEEQRLEASSDDEEQRMETPSDDEEQRMEASSDDEEQHMETSPDDEEQRMETSADDEES